MDGTVGRPYLIKENFLQPEEYYQLLITANTALCINRAPVKPKPGEIYIYKNSKNRTDWKCDQHRWRHKGIGHLPSKNPIVTCNYFSTYAGSGFKKRAYWIYSDTDEHVNEKDTVLIHYLGSLKDVVHLCHGNRKKNQEVLHVTTAKEQICKQKRSLVDVSIDKTYKKLCLEPLNPLHMPVYHPKNKKQVSNTIRNEQDRKLLTSDDLYGLYLIDQEFKGFVSRLVLLKHFVCILVSTDMLKIYSTVCEEGNCTLFYDTTFNLGDFYLSVLAFKNPVFRNEPTIPLAYLIHHYKNKDTHLEFFSHIRNICPVIQDKVIVTDGEKAIVHAINKELPNCTHFYCWNHIQQDVKNWTKKLKNAEKCDSKTYVQHTWDLLDSNSIDDFYFKYDRMILHWSREFKHYFDNYIKPLIIKSGKWMLLQHKIYTERSGITINRSESLNAVLKRFLGHQEVKVQIIALSLYQLDKYYQCEILKGFSDSSNEYILKVDSHDKFYTSAETLEWPVTENIPIDKLPYIFTNQDKNVEKSETPFTKFSVAKMLVLEGRVRLITEQQCFIVSSDTDKYIVTLYPNEKCSCKAKKNCHHIKAAQISIGQDSQDKKNIKLTTLMRKNRGLKSGRKNLPQKLKVVEAADDSVSKISEGNTTTLLIPTVSRNQIKHRFYDPELIRKSDTSSSEIFTSTPKKERCKVINVQDASSNSKNARSVQKIPSLLPKEDVLKNFLRKKENIYDSQLSSLDDTIRERFQRNAQFTVMGCQLYPSEVTQLTTTNVSSVRDKYIADSILDVYFKILIYETKKTHDNVTVFSTESFIFQTMDFDESFKMIMAYFLKHRIPEYDVVIMPIVCNSHCSVLTIFRKQKNMVYLDSLNGNILQEHINFVRKLYLGYYVFKGLEQDIDEWNIISPADMPKQTNSYDCGAYCCMFVETLLSQNKDLLQYHFTENMLGYRYCIKEKILSYMNNTNTKGLQEKIYTFNKEKLKNLEEPRIEKSNSLEILRNIPNFNSFIEFLVTSIDRYWDEDTEGSCFFGVNCVDIKGLMMLCEKCNHWYHAKCYGFKKRDIPKTFICLRCI